MHQHSPSFTSPSLRVIAPHFCGACEFGLEPMGTGRGQLRL